MVPCKEEYCDLALVAPDDRIVVHSGGCNKGGAIVATRCEFRSCASKQKAVQRKISGMSAMRSQDFGHRPIQVSCPQAVHLTCPATWPF